jgi:type VI protein secretion system component VasF
METSKLLDLCEPLFQSICRLNRANRKGSAPSYFVTSREIDSIFRQMSDEARKNAGLEIQYRSIEMPLMFFVDSVIAESSLPFAAEWDRHRLAYKQNELAGDQKFFDFLEIALEEAKAKRTEGATNGGDERLAVFYTCLGLGFTGLYAGQYEYVEKTMLELSPWVRKYVDTDDSALVTPDAYEHTSFLNFPLPVSDSLIPLSIVICGLFILVGWMNFYTFHRMYEEMARALSAIIGHAPKG